MRVFHLIGVVVAVVLVITSGPCGAQAQSHAGGLPAVSDRVTVLEGIAVNLQTAVTTLQSNVTTLKTSVTNLQTNVTTLQTKVTTLETENTDLQSALNAEIAARKAADAGLQAALDVEAFTRKVDDIVINQTITRSVADLNARIDNARGQAFSTFKHKASLVNGGRALVGSVGPLPAGNYLIVARAAVHNHDNNSVWSCSLVRDDGISIDSSAAGTAAPEFLDDLGPDWSNIVQIAVTSLPSEMKVNMFCGTGETGSDLFDIAMTAVQVGQATIACPNLAFACPGD